ncbi:unnamed protein product [Pieris macdunnoughi]|uniref:Uncharacterized protein n=1 Tax=Pieris macdunnoughi TaxID=345717 RepID=A0A821XR07_9NEOP|nr:unnamed protein product [Pieris macdunnoughi]
MSDETFKSHFRMRRDTFEFLLTGTGLAKTICPLW